MIFKDVIYEASKKLNINKIQSFILDSEILLADIIKKDREYLLTNLNKKISKTSLYHYKKLINERSKGIPIAYLIKKKDFWKFEFSICRNVLIPRPDTEIIVENVLKLTKNKERLKILDIGVGSGCILLSILKEKKNFKGIGIDISKKCIKLSKINANNLNINNRIKFFKSDVDNFNYGKYDLIISNPPYIKSTDFKYLEKDVSKFEPKLALDGGVDGLSEIRKVINKSSELIKNNGKLILEVAFDQKSKVINLLKEKGFYINRVLKDLGNNDRCIISNKI